VPGPTPVRSIRTIGVTLALSLALSACSAPANSTPKDETSASAAPAVSATPTASVAPTASEAPAASPPADQGPQALDGVPTAAPEGWTAGTCNGLNLATPSGWTVEGDAVHLGVFNLDEPAVTVGTGDAAQVIPQTIFFGCNGKWDWDGSWQTDESADFYELNVEGMEFASVSVHPHASAQDRALIDGEFFEATIRLVTPEQDYYTIAFTLPVDGRGLDFVREVVSSLSVA
jgi:hypothetical protein